MHSRKYLQKSHFVSEMNVKSIGINHLGANTDANKREKKNN